MTSPLREVRQRRGMSLRQFELTTGIQRGYWSAVERGKRQPTPPTMLRAAEALGLEDLARTIRTWWGMDGGDA